MTGTEATYPNQFRAQDVATLIDHLKHHNSVNLIGMKRVGINNFLRFFFQHSLASADALPDIQERLFIHVDLNDLIEREIDPFWILTLKRIVDALETSQVKDEVKEKAQKYFGESIQLKDLFVTIDSIRKVLNMVVDSGVYITIVFNRFDRMKEAATSAFFENLQSLRDHANAQLSYIFTSYRPLTDLRPDVFTKQSMSVFCQDMYLKPATHDDASTILHTFEDRYKLNLKDDIRDEFLQITGGHVQFIHLSMIKLKDAGQVPQTRPELIELLLSNEEALLQSEELLDSLTEKELTGLHQLASEDQSLEKLKDYPYLTNTGMVTVREEKPVVFSPLLRQAIIRRIGQKTNGATKDFTKKEHLLFTFLKQHEGELCEREDLVEAVWPEYAESGVSDWAVDRLVARVRQKLKTQESEYEIVTVITRGYKLVKKT